MPEELLVLLLSRDRDLDLLPVHAEMSPSVPDIASDIASVGLGLLYLSSGWSRWMSVAGCLRKACGVGRFAVRSGIL